ncbi:MAG TPA: diaminopimelate epimerase [Acidobacteriota bacterium]|nr:diaminopimelate epimerase [Acidobacteriota bacterium]HNT17101.1 diaminopimelate epimerase [Acidobacteriota bacterium]HPA26113.1 diaminopimelate epimerase [Acidobacteriota bacterium]HQO19254.1 diaminopimelate epimerase [Acidobacteriota bacterium]HQQ46066.1 diaminopimelate epimerase [Acidobacteriota bacterium]
MLEFFKMSGAGNDFILGDNRAPVWDYYRMNRMVPAICARGTGVGADGVILLENSKKARFMIRIFNSDGLEADFCGNGLRCAARYAMLKVIAGKRMTIETRVGVAEAELTKEDEVLATFPMKASAPEKMELDVRGKKVTGYMVHAGVPHFVIFVKDAGLVPLMDLAPAIRSHPSLPEGGANVDFLEHGKEPFPYRTFERGVEGETLACGSGALAIGWLLRRKFNKQGRSKLLTRSGKILEVDYEKEKSALVAASLRGEARFIYKASLSDEAIREFLK